MTCIIVFPVLCCVELAKKVMLMYLSLSLILQAQQMSISLDSMQASVKRVVSEYALKQNFIL